MRGSHLLARNFRQKKLTNCNPYFTALQDINNLETQRSYKTTTIEVGGRGKAPVNGFKRRVPGAKKYGCEQNK